MADREPDEKQSGMGKLLIGGAMLAIVLAVVGMVLVAAATLRGL